MSCPENCIRGILKAHFVVKDQDLLYATVELFHFRRSDRSDGMLEASINWKDDEKAIEFTLNQKDNDGALKYDGGIAILPRSELDRVKKRYGSEKFGYERSYSPDNKYHGNLLLHSRQPAPFRRLICSVLAHNSEIQSRNSIQST